MTKLSDAISRASRREARPIGFTSAATARNPTILVLARTTAAGAAEAAKGADAVIITDGALSKMLDVAVDLWGSEAPVEGRGGAKALHEAGASFLVFDADTTAAALLEEDLGYVMRVDMDATDTFLRTLDSLPLDALLVPSLEGALTVRSTLDLRRISSFARKPLILGVATDIEPVDLEALRDCGVIGVVADGVGDAEALRTKIDGLPPRRRPSNGRGVSVALRATGDSYQVEEMPVEPEEE